MKKVIMFTVALLVALSAGCAHLQEGSFEAKTAIQFATLKLIDEDSERADRVHAVVQKAKGLLDGEEVTNLDTLESTVRAEIKWSKLDQAESLLVSNLIDAVRLEIENRINDRQLNPEEVVAVRNVLIWIEEAAQMAGGGTDVGSNEIVSGSSVVHLRREVGRAADGERPGPGHSAVGVLGRAPAA